MDKRLRTIYDLIQPGIGMIDVGTDHAYLPCELALNGYKGNIIASDINKGPLESAEKNAEKCGVKDKMSFTLCAGLDKCDPETIDTIVIAGMGGDMICGILDKAEWCMNKRYHLILQPMTKAEVLRYWLCYNGFEMRDHIVHEGRFYYHIIEAVFRNENSNYTEAELYTGKFETIRDYEFVKEYLEKELNRNTKELEGKLASGSGDLSVKKEIIQQLKAMKENIYDKNQ